MEVVHEQSRQDNFPMKLRSEFESVPSNLMNMIHLPPWMFFLGNYSIKSTILSYKMLKRKKTMSQLNLFTKVKERKGIWLELNAIVSRNIVIFVEIVLRSFVIIVNKDTLIKYVPHALKTIG